MSTPRTIDLIPPLLSDLYIKEKISCIRAHRERIFNVSIQKYNNKYIFHNYGQGGAGWTFLFGCVNESIRLLEQHKKNPHSINEPIAIIGAGCYGLLTAITLARKGYLPHIVAQDLNTISSNKAAGFFFARPRKSSTPTEKEIFEKFGMESYITYQEISQGKHPFIHYGPRIIPYYFGLEIDPGFEPYYTKGLMSKPEKVVINFGNSKVYHMHEYKALFINPSTIMQELWRTIKELGISIQQIKIDSFDQLDEQIIFNCAGLGAKALTGDQRVVPVQGHLISLKSQLAQPYMINVNVIQKVDQYHKKTVIGSMRNELIYYAPKEEGILGVTFIRGQDSLTANDYEFERLIERSRNFFGT